MTHIDTLIESCWMLPIAPKNTILKDHAVAIHEGNIVDILPASEAKKRYDAKEHQALKHHIVMPGLVNAHAHTAMNLFRGFADDLALMDWLNQYIWPAEQAVLTPESTYVGTQLAVAEMLRSGVTCFNDHYFFPEASARAAADVGIRACIGLWVGNVPTLWGTDEADYLRKADAQLNSGFHHDLISWSMAVHGTYTIDDHGLHEAKAMADRYQLPVHMHVHETIDELNIEAKRSGKRPIERIEDAGLLNEHLTAVHMVHLNDEDCERIKSSGCHIVTCPESNLKLGTGLPPLQMLNELTSQLAIGTDGACSNNDLDMIGEMRTTSMVAKGQARDATALPAPRILEMATLGGANAMQLGHKIGSLEKGKAADIIAINIDDLFTQPMYDCMSHVVFAANRLQVRHVWVDGKQLLKDGEFTQLSAKRIMESAEPIIEKARPMAHHYKA